MGDEGRPLPDRAAVRDVGHRRHDANERVRPAAGPRTVRVTDRRSRGDRNRPRRGTDRVAACRANRAGATGARGAAAFRGRVAEVRRRKEDCGRRGRGRADEEGLGRGRRGQAHGGPRADEEARGRRAEPEPKEEPEPPPEPKWIRELGATDRRNARRLIERLRDLDISDPETIARAEFAQREPAVARVALERQLRAATRSAKTPEAAVKAAIKIILAGKDDELDAEWRLTDGQGRSIDSIDVSD